ncbi:ParB/Srx family N-terminal domain-containing protein [Vibrio crassostreae]|uniref:ParB/Srx family N-terminal domain-containing protein n=1 Tax=Vibrio crassostreae TaxID=246167 RepID=UPI000633D907|nr:ParB/Srx family N-terminal domain-containing protein [Vibrio crassostreae]CAH6804694.1 ParB/RepB/Spo0J family partition protein [Vibrio chagasii]CAH6815002.1 ParB/RepB/Spo0J family partition protein [Vibrio chagasii]CAH6819478.1 ParB/RepB/Spo0J family partition protein [Vibrio chagasii]CAH6826718.1 ParB/RepB/Spo0J family partition protein [Vibrio chagasii]CAH6862136.1 ParB/RepB/Spo0J family partition protein [Vibrio chagasii]
MTKTPKTAKKPEFYEYSVKSVHDLTPYENNPNAHDDKNIEELSNSINEFGFTNPLLIDENDKIFAGHGRWEAAKYIGMERVPCIILTGLTETQKRAYVIADNTLPFGSVWDESMLQSELEALEAEGFDMDILALDNIDDLDFLDFNPAALEDGHANDSNETITESDTKLVIGEYSFPIERREYLNWQDDIRAEAGFSKEDVIAEIKQRLRICSS